MNLVPSLKPKGLLVFLTQLIKFLDILINEFLKHLPLFHDVDHKNEVVHGFTPPFKSPYQFNKKELQH
jgi:hypothetical protein